MSGKHVVILKNDAVGDLVHSLEAINNIVNDVEIDKITIYISKLSKKFDFLFKNSKVNIKVLNYNLTIFEKVKIFNFILINKIYKVYILSPKRFYYLLPIFFLKTKFYAICVNKYDSSVNMKKAVLVDLMLLEKKEQFSLDLILSCLEESRKSNCHLFQIVGFDDKKRKFMYKLSPFSRRNKFSPYLFKSENLELTDLLQNKDSWYPNELEGDSIF